MNKVWQEIHCTTSGAGCGGYILVKIDVSINKRVTLICPKCKHEHRRAIKNGQVVEEGRHAGESQEELCPTIAAWSKTPRTKCMEKVVQTRDFKRERDGAIIKTEDDFIAPPATMGEVFLRESWIEKFLGKV
jgi:hypothetical protein